MRRGMIAVVVALLAWAVPTPAHADLVVCNDSRARTLSVAWALQHGTFITSPFSVSGWEHVGPNRCETMGRGDLAGASIWVRAVWQGAVVTRGERSTSSRVHDSNQQFCISDRDFGYDRRDVGATRDCPAGSYLATFPVTVWHTRDLSTLTLHLDPDDLPAQTGTATPTPGPRPPDLHGALAVSSNGTHYASYLYESQAVARRRALEYCRAEEGAGSTCTLGASFKNQCIAVAAGALGPTQVLGQPGWDRARTLSSAITKCTQAGGGQCKEVIAACSTQAGLAAQKNKRDAEGRQQVGKALGDALRILFGQESPGPTSPPTRPRSSTGGTGFGPLVQICTPRISDATGRFPPAVQADLDKGVVTRHFNAVDVLLDAMKADSRSALRTTQGMHLQLVIPHYRTPDKTPHVQTLQMPSQLRCPADHTHKRYALADWLAKPGMSPRDLQQR